MARKVFHRLHSTFLSPVFWSGNRNWRIKPYFFRSPDAVESLPDPFSSHSEIDAEIGPPKEMRVAPEQVEREFAAAGFRTQVVPESMPRHYLIVANKD